MERNCTNCYEIVTIDLKHIYVTTEWYAKLNMTGICNKNVRLCFISEIMDVDVSNRGYYEIKQLCLD